jgi:hypothetical protein
MTEPLPEFDLGIIGGCMSHQRGTPLNALYHRQLAAMLSRDPGVRMRAHIVRGFGLDYASRLDRLLAGPRIDGVLVHVREATIVAAARAFVTESMGDRRRRRVNPAMLRRGHPHVASGPAAVPGPPGKDAREPDAYSDGDDDLQDMPLPGRRIAGVRLRNVNFMLGVMTGLGGWAIEDELLRFDELARACRERGVPLFVLGPTPVTYSIWARRITRQANGRIRRHLSGIDVPCALVEGTSDAAGRPLTRRDGFHMTIAGHEFIAEQLYEQGVRPWVASILATRERPRSDAGTEPWGIGLTG